MEITTIDVEELRDKLGAYLAEVRRGRWLLVRDGARIIAEIRPRHECGTCMNPVLEKWARQGRVTLPTRPKGPLERSGLRFPRGTAERWIREDRNEE